MGTVAMLHEGEERGTVHKAHIGYLKQEKCMELQVRANQGNGRSRELRGKEVQTPLALRKKDAAIFAQEIYRKAVQKIIRERQKGEARASESVDFGTRRMPSARWFEPMLSGVRERLKRRFPGKTFKVATVTQFLNDENACRVIVSADW